MLRRLPRAALPTVERCNRHHTLGFRLPGRLRSPTASATCTWWPLHAPPPSGPPAEQQVADIVRVTVDDEVDTGTFAAIVADVATDVLR